MTTSTWVGPLSQSSDANFRAWGLELSTKLQAMNLIKTADTGQINWTTVVRAANNTAAGYEIYQFNDSLQSTAPIFFKLEYGTANISSNPQMWITVGTGSNGSGTITGITTSRDSICIQAVPLVGNYTSYLCVADGFFGLIWKLNALTGSIGAGFLVISRTFDSNGAVTDSGFRLVNGSTANTVVCNSQSVRTVADSQTAFTTSSSYALVPGTVVGSLVGSDIQIYPHFGINPEVWIMPTMAVAILSEVSPGTTVSIAMVGNTPRTLLSVGGTFRSVIVGTGPGTIATYGHLMLWE